MIFSAAYALIFWVLQLLPLLASALEFGSATAPALTALLKMGSWLPTEDFNSKVLLIALLDMKCLYLTFMVLFLFRCLITIYRVW